MNIPHRTFKLFDDYRQALEHAAGLCGIEQDYWDIWGNHHVVAPEVQRRILESLGVAAGDLGQLNQSIEQRLWDEWSAPVAPVVVTGESDAPAAVSVRLPASLADRAIRAGIEYEDGTSSEARHDAAELETTGTAELRGQKFVEKSLPLPRAPLGYHRLHITFAPNAGPNWSGVADLIVAPDRAYQPAELQNGGRRAGLYVSLYGIRSARSWGCGDFSDLERLTVWVGDRLGGSFVALNPLHAIHNRQPFNTSPYLPNCIFYQNFIYLDIERIEDFQNCRWARDLRSSGNIVAEIAALNATELVEYERVARLKQAFLKLAFRQFLREYRDGSDRAAEFRRFVEEEGELLDRFAVYCALDEWIHRRHPSLWTWPEWPEQYRDPASETVREFAQKRWRSVLFYKYVQWQINRQLSEAQAAARRHGLSIGLFHDLALATDRYGSDLWAHRDFFVAGCRVGAPPDDFSPRGQDWSFPPPSTIRHRENGYRHFRQTIRNSCRHGGALRIDHVMRFFRLFWIPAGMEAIDGTYVKDHYEDLVRILALESVRNKVVVIGEDLGTVEPSVRETLAQFGILSYRLFYFERDAAGKLRAPDEYPAQALVSSTTHDLPTLAGFWRARDVEARHEAGVFPDEASYHGALEARRREKQAVLDRLHDLRLVPGNVPRRAEQLPVLTGELHNAIIGFLASTPSMLLALNQEDLTKETEQQNLPGTTAQHPNWQRKMRYSLEELETSKTVDDFARMFRHWLEKTGRVAEGGAGASASD